MKKIDKVKDARRRARQVAQKPGAVQIIPDKSDQTDDTCSWCGIRGCDGDCFNSEQEN